MRTSRHSAKATVASSAATDACGKSATDGLLRIVSRARVRGLGLGGLLLSDPLAPESSDLRWIRLALEEAMLGDRARECLESGIQVIRLEGEDSRIRIAGGK